MKTFRWKILAVFIFLLKTQIVQGYLLETHRWGGSNEYQLFKYIENFISKNWKFSDKKLRYLSYLLHKTEIVGTR